MNNSFAAFQEEIQDTSNCFEIQDAMNFAQADIEMKPTPDRKVTTCSNCNCVFLNSSLDANHFEELCGKCHKNLKDALSDGK
jgi:hypothetical protein